MRRNGWVWFRSVLATAAVLLGFGASARAVADEPPARTEPVPILVTPPADLGALLKALERPDFVILRGDEYDRLRKAGPPTAPASGTVVESVEVRGTVRGDLAELTVGFGVDLGAETSRPAWVDLRLDGQTLASARESGRDLPVRVAEGGAWQVELARPRRHQVEVTLLAPVRGGAEGRRLELAIPPAASTRFSVDLPQRVSDATAGPGEPVAHEADRSSGLTRLSATLAPRARLAVVWKVEEEAGAALPPLLVAQGEIAVDVEPGTIRTRSSWSIRSRRGTARDLQLLIDPDDEVLELELDGQPPPAGREQVGTTTRMTIPLTDPLGPGQERKLVMTTRRRTEAGGVARTAFRGFPFVSAREQTGVIGVAQVGDLWVSGVAGRGVRPIDPRFDLPDDLRTRPATVRAYQFTEQPFELDLTVAPSPPLVRAEARTTVVLDPGSARVDTWLDVQPTRGRLDDVALALPPGFRVEAVGPDDLVGSWQTGNLSAAPLNAAAALGVNLLAVRLDPKRVAERGRFSLHVAGRQPIDLSGGSAVAVGLVQPVGVTSAGGRVAVVTDPSLSAELAPPEEGGAGPAAFRPATSALPADWFWPADRPRQAAPTLWLRYDDSPSDLRLRVASHPVRLRQSTSLAVRLDRRGADVQQETECSVRFGAVDHLDVTVPDALEGRWEVDRAVVASRTDLGRASENAHAYRLVLAAELTRTVRLRFRYRVPITRELGPGRTLRLPLPWVRVSGPAAEATSPVRATVRWDSDLDVAWHGEGWAPDAEGPAPAPALTEADEPGAGRFVVSADGAKAGALDLLVEALVLADLPKLVVPRLVLRSVQTAEGAVRTTATFEADSTDPALSVVLPPGAGLERAVVAGQAVRQVEQLPQGQGVRVRLPERTPGAPVAVEIDYAVPPSRAQGAWTPPALGGGLVQQTYWEVCVPWNRALVGVPDGWTDENEWYWHLYVWKRRPRKPAPVTAAGASQCYLFSRPGGPAPMPVALASRAWLVGVCSGSVLALGGFLILVWRPSFRLVWGAAAGLGLSAAVLVQPDLTLLVVQSATVGLMLTALLALMQRASERRRSRGGFGDPSGRGPAVMSGSTLSRAVEVGSDDSTAIRKRPVSTVDHAPASPPPAFPAVDPESTSTRGPWPGRVGQGGPV